MRESAGADTPLSAVAEGHADLLRAYFGFQAYGGLVAGALLLLSPVLGHQVTIQGKGNTWIAILLFALGTWGAFWTRRLLRDHDRQGALMAAGTFACNLLAARSAGHLGLGAVISGVGLVLAANVYRHYR